jgi:hypothetical protein
MGDAKYIIVDDGMCIYPVIFHKLVKHSVMAECVRQTVISAGFVTSSGEAYGKSVSLGVASKPGDTKMIQQMLGMIDDDDY